jgi:hypothetical protein
VVTRGSEGGKEPRPTRARAPQHAAPRTGGWGGTCPRLARRTRAGAPAAPRSSVPSSSHSLVVTPLVVGARFVPRPRLTPFPAAPHLLLPAGPGKGRQPPDDGICKWYRHGTCHLGDACKFSHAAEGPVEGHTASLGERRRPLLHMAVLFAADGRIGGYAKALMTKFTDAGVDVFCHVSARRRRNTWGGPPSS